MSLYAERTEELLQIHKLKRTPGRVALLKQLAIAKGPVSIEYLQEKLPGKLSVANVYRALEAFLDRGMAVRFEFGSGRAYYELAHDRRHHHHAICESCGKVEDIPAHDSPLLTKLALKSAPGFARFTRHSLEFYGLCTSCV
jgi:Fe2+ or Zn2+ uptake regulation protein